MANLRVSVVIPTYNRASLVPRAVESVLTQLGPEDELIVVDDGSTDGTEAALAPWRGRIHYLRLPHGGAGRARNAGWAVARGELVAFLDSDDEWLPGKLTLQRALLAARPELAFCWTDFASKDAEGWIAPRSLASWQETDTPRPWGEIVGPARPLSSLLEGVPEADGCDVHVGDLYLWLMRVSCVSLMSCLVRRSALPEGLRCAEDLPTYEDWEGVARIARRGPGAFIARDLVLNHRHAGPRLSGARHLAKLQARAAILERVWGGRLRIPGPARRGVRAGAARRSPRPGAGIPGPRPARGCAPGV